MTSELDLVRDLTDQSTPLRARRDLIGEFAKKFGWRPSDFVETSSYLTTASLVVEQGLDNAVVLSFLPSDRRLCRISRPMNYVAFSDSLTTV